MKNLTLIAAVALIVGAAACKKITIIEETITEVGEGPAEIDVYGTWEYQNPDTSDKEIILWKFEKGSSYYQRLEVKESGLAEIEYGTWFITPTHFRRRYYGNLPYRLSGDSLIFGKWWDGDIVRVFTKTTGNLDNKFTDASVTRSLLAPSFHSVYDNQSFGIDGDFLYVNHRSNGTYKFFKWNTLTGLFTDSVNAPTNTYYPLHYKASTNKLYNTRYSGTYNMQQRTGLTGANSNLSSNGLSSIRAISSNPSSGTVYASRNSIIYSGTEGGNFSTLKSFSGDYPRGIVYYKNDQFLGSYRGSLVLFEVAPELKIIKQYTIPGKYIEDGIATNGTAVWVISYNDQYDTYEYSRVTLN